MIDFKGHFRTGDWQRGDPLTVTESARRYPIATQIVAPTHNGVPAAVEVIFNCYGLPFVRSDDGSPFGLTGAGGLSKLSAWFIKLGIEPVDIRPASPARNGRHERRLRTIKAQTNTSATATRAERQARLDDFRCHYDRERPHEALDQTLASTRWRPSVRALLAFQLTRDNDRTPNSDRMSNH